MNSPIRVMSPALPGARRAWHSRLGSRCRVTEEEGGAVRCLVLFPRLPPRADGRGGWRSHHERSTP